MTFNDFEKALAEHFSLIQTAYGAAYQTDADKDELWNTYLQSFPSRINPLYRVRTEHDCSCCRHFIKHVGGIVLIDEELNIHTLWEFRVDDPDWQVVADAMDVYVKNRKIRDVFLSKENYVGVQQSYESDVSGNVHTWRHLFLKLPDAYRFSSRDTPDTQLADKRTNAQVFLRSLKEISSEAIDTVLELISSGTLYRGEEWKRSLESFRGYKTNFDILPVEKQELFAWKNAEMAGAVIGRIRNHSIGVLLTDISDGMDLNDAVTKYEKIVAPTNYKRPKAIFTAKMLEDAKKTVSNLGFIDSLARRYARLDDISVNNILFVNRDSAKQIGGVFDEMKSEVAVNPKRFDRVSEIQIDKFVSDILPSAREIEAFVENRHAKNMVSLIAPVNKESPSMFKWDNAYGWAYTGNMTDSDIRENVKAAGGNVDGILRFSIQWNDLDYDANDLDAHCVEPDGSEIYYRTKKSFSTKGELDVDIIHPISGKPAVENIVYPSRRNMVAGTYRFYVYQYSNRGGRKGFRAELAVDGQVINFDYDKELRQGEAVEVADVILNQNGTFTVVSKLPATSSSRDLWGVKTMNFVPVSVIMYSPNYWDGQNGNGNKHYMFMLKGCVNPEQPNGFYNEFLKQELLPHKRVFEALGSKLAVTPSEEQLSGLGFSSTQRNDLIVKVKGATEQIMKIKF